MHWYSCCRYLPEPCSEFTPSFPEYGITDFVLHTTGRYSPTQQRLAYIWPLNTFRSTLGYRSPSHWVTLFLGSAGGDGVCQPSARITYDILRDGFCEQRAEWLRKWLTLGPIQVHLRNSGLLSVRSPSIPKDYTTDKLGQTGLTFLLPAPVLRHRTRELKSALPPNY